MKPGTVNPYSEGKYPVGVTVVANRLFPPNQQLGTMAAQPTRFSARNPNYPMQACLTSVAAARLFSSVVCMSSNAVDASLREDETPKMAKWRNEATLFYGAPFSIPNVHFSSSEKEPLSLFITDAAVRIRTGEFCQEGKQPFRAFKLATRGHVAIALWDLENKIVEVFDPSGSAQQNPDTIFQEQLLRKLFDQHPGPKFEKIRFTNLSNLQESRADVHCQTWIYWYVYERTINKKSPKEAIQLAQSLPPQQRLSMIASFWNFLASKT